MKLIFGMQNYSAPIRWNMKEKIRLKTDLATLENWNFQVTWEADFQKQTRNLTRWYTPSSSILYHYLSTLKEEVGVWHLRNVAILFISPWHLILRNISQIYRTCIWIYSCMTYHVAKTIHQSVSLGFSQGSIFFKKVVIIKNCKVL